MKKTIWIKKAGIIIMVVIILMQSVYLFQARRILEENRNTFVNEFCTYLSTFSERITYHMDVNEAEIPVFILKNLDDEMKTAVFYWNAGYEATEGISMSGKKGFAERELINGFANEIEPRIYTMVNKREHGMSLSQSDLDYLALFKKNIQILHDALMTPSDNAPLDEAFKEDYFSNCLNTFYASMQS